MSPQTQIHKHWQRPVPTRFVEPRSGVRNTSRRPITTCANRTLIRKSTLQHSHTLNHSPHIHFHEQPHRPNPKRRRGFSQGQPSTQGPRGSRQTNQRSMHGKSCCEETGLNNNNNTETDGRTDGRTDTFRYVFFYGNE